MKKYKNKINNFYRKSKQLNGGKIQSSKTYQPNIKT